MIKRGRYRERPEMIKKRERRNTREKEWEIKRESE